MAFFTSEHQAAFKDFTERAYHRTKGGFDVTYPPRDSIWSWIHAALAENADECSGAKQKAELTEPHANLIFNQARRGFGFGNYAPPGERMEKEEVRAMAALLAALTGSWDLVGQSLGRPLSRTVQKNRTFEWTELSGIVRHVATAARHRLGAGASATALRAWAKHEKPDRPLLLALARLAIADAGGHPRGEVSQRLDAILAGETPKDVQRAASPVDDPRASVFEKYQPVLLNEKRRNELRREVLSTSNDLPVWPDHFAEAWLLGIDEAADLAQDIDDNGHVWPSPAAIVVAAIGRPLERRFRPWREEVQRSLDSLRKSRQLNQVPRYRKSTHVAAVALAMGDTKLLKKVTAGPAKERFVPGKTFGDDPRKVMRYFGLALDQKKPKAKQSDVSAAFFELLVSRIPDNHDDSISGGSYSWASLMCIAYCYFHLLGKTPEGKVGDALRATLRGEAT